MPIPIVAQGTLAEGLPSQGYYVTPTLLGRVPADHAVAQDEIFGPVLATMPFETEAEAIALAVRTPFETAVIRRHAERFGRQRFGDEIETAIRAAVRYPAGAAGAHA